MPGSIELVQLRSFVADDSHSCTYQTFGQYRTALLNKIDSLAAAMPSPEKAMSNDYRLPIATTAYPAAHPYPCAVRRVVQLERLVLSGVIVQVDELTRHTATAYGGMHIDTKGPWVTIEEVMGRARKPVQFTRDAAETFAQELIAQGWHNDSETCVDGLQGLLTAFLSKQMGVVKS
jgi:hypothetical protein